MSEPALPKGLSRETLEVYDQAVQLATGTVVDGKVIIKGEPLPDGTVVTILARDADETFDVPPELEAELVRSIAEADGGASIPANQVLDRLHRIA